MAAQLATGGRSFAGLTPVVQGLLASVLAFVAVRALRRRPAS